MNISENIKKIREKIETALGRSDFNNNVKLLAVSKKISQEKILKAYESGQTLFGENYVQEGIKKIESLNLKNANWHFIGALQTNKVKYCIDKFSMIESVDREKLALEINRDALKRGIRDYPVLIEINLASETSKSGINPGNVMDLLEKLSPLEGIKVKGLMAIPPYFNNPEDSRPYFIKLRKLFQKIKQLNIARIEMKELSMGMSNDFEVAVEEGATIVRVGTAIFGPRE